MDLLMVPNVVPQSSERKGNLFRLLCIAYTTKGRNSLMKSLNSSESKWRQFIKFLKMYLAMEEWFHDCNDKEEVKSSRTEISKVLSSIQRLFPRDDNTNGYNIPKMHGMTNMQVYIQLFGSAMNFYGGPGEAAHKTFVKSAGQKTQRRVSEFAKQTANQYYNMMLTSYAVSICDEQNGELKQMESSSDELTETEKLNNNLPCCEFGNDDDTVQLSLSGKFDFHVSNDVINKMATECCDLFQVFICFIKTLVFLILCLID